MSSSPLVVCMNSSEAASSISLIMSQPPLEVIIPCFPFYSAYFNCSIIIYWCDVLITVTADMSFLFTTMPSVVGAARFAAVTQ